MIIICRTLQITKIVVLVFRFMPAGHGQELGEFALTSFLILIYRLLAFCIVALCALLIILSIDVDIGSSYAVTFGIFRVVCPFFAIIIGILVFTVVSNVTFSSTYYTR